MSDHAGGFTAGFGGDLDRHLARKGRLGGLFKQAGEFPHGLKLAGPIHIGPPDAVQFGRVLGMRQRELPELEVSAAGILSSSRIVRAAFATQVMSPL